jgi:hypothetical protein
MNNFYKKAIVEAVCRSSDTELLDLVYKLLVAEAEPERPPAQLNIISIEEVRAA